MATLTEIYQRVENNREEVILFAMEALRPFPHCKRGELPGNAIHYLFDCDAIFNHYEKLFNLSSEEICMIQEFDSADGTTHPVDLEQLDCRLYAEAARRLGYTEVAEELERIAEDGL